MTNIPSGTGEVGPVTAVKGSPQRVAPDPGGAAQGGQDHRRIQLTFSGDLGAAQGQQKAGLQEVEVLWAHNYLPLSDSATGWRARP